MLTSKNSPCPLRTHSQSRVGTQVGIRQHSATRAILWVSTKCQGTQGVWALTPTPGERNMIAENASYNSETSWPSPDGYMLGEGDEVDEVGEGRIFILHKTSSPGKKSDLGRNLGGGSQAYERR